MASSDAARLMASIQALVRRFSLVERADVACCGMTVAQAATLTALSSGGSLPLGELRRRLGIAPSTMTRNLERLRGRGLVATASDPDDGRAALVSLTEAGRRAAADVAGQEGAFALSVIESLGQAHSRTVADALERLLGAVRTASRSCCPGAFDHLMDDAPWRGGQNDERSDAPDPSRDC